MYKTTAKVETARRDYIEVEMNSKKDNVEIYVRNVIDCKIHREAGIHISPEGFIDLVLPILQARGYRLEVVPEAV